MPADLALEFESKGAPYTVKTEVYPHNSGFNGKWVELRWELYHGSHIGNGMLASDDSLGGWVCRMAEIRPRYKGRGLYRSVLRILRKHYGPIISDSEMSDDAVRAWEHIPEAVYDEKLDRWRLNPAPHAPVISYAAAHRWEPLAKAKGVSAVARSPRGFMRAYEKAGTWARLDPWWKARRNAFVARHMAQGRHEPLWKRDKSGKLQPSRRCLALLMWGFKP